MKFALIGAAALLGAANGLAATKPQQHKKPDPKELWVIVGVTDDGTTYRDRAHTYPTQDLCVKSVKLNIQTLIRMGYTKIGCFQQKDLEDAAPAKREPDQEI